MPQEFDKVQGLTKEPKISSLRMESTGGLQSCSTK